LLFAARYRSVHAFPPPPARTCRTASCRSGRGFLTTEICFPALRGGREHGPGGSSPVHPILSSFWMQKTALPCEEGVQAKPVALRRKVGCASLLSPGFVVGFWPDFLRKRRVGWRGRWPPRLGSGSWGAAAGGTPSACPSEGAGGCGSGCPHAGCRLKRCSHLYLNIKYFYITSARSACLRPHSSSQIPVLFLSGSWFLNCSLCISTTFNWWGFLIFFF